jgi:hypothetical protein
MVALVDDQMPIAADPIVNYALAHQALNDGNVDEARWLPPTSPDLSHSRSRNVQECRESVDPLLEQLPAVNEHECVDAALRDQPGGHDCLAECSGCRQHACLVRQKRLGRSLLLGSKLAAECHVQGLTAEPLVADVCGDVEVFEELPHIIEAAARQRDVRRVLFRTTHDPRPAKCR